MIISRTLHLEPFANIQCFFCVKRNVIDKFQSDPLWWSIFGQEFKMYLPLKRIFSDEDFCLSRDRPKIFSTSKRKRILKLMIWTQTHNKTRPKVAFCIWFLLLRYGRNFLSELFSKNVTFAARVCPPLGAGD